MKSVGEIRTNIIKYERRELLGTKSGINSKILESDLLITSQVEKTGPD